MGGLKTECIAIVIHVHQYIIVAGVNWGGGASAPPAPPVPTPLLTLFRLEKLRRKVKDKIGREPGRCCDHTFWIWPGS